MKAERSRERKAVAVQKSEDMVEGLIQAYRPLVYAIARQLQPKAPTDEDLLQCGLIGLWRAAERWDGIRPFGPLARHCARSEMVDHMRRSRERLRTVPLEAVADQLIYEEDWSAIEVADGAERACPPGSRARAAVLALSDGQSLSQTAKALGVRRGRVKGMARRAWKKANEGES